MNKKIICTFLLVLTIFASICYADTMIGEISIAGGTYPRPGEHPNYSWTVHTFEENKYSFDYTKVKWVNLKTYDELPNDYKFEYGGKYRLEISFKPKEGYYFDTANNMKVSFYNFDTGYTYIVRAAGTGNQPNRVVLCSFYLPCLVTFDTDGGTEISSQEVEIGKKATKPKDPVKDGYDFLGWYEDKAYTSKAIIENFTINSNTTFYAKFVPKDEPLKAKLYDLDLGTIEEGYDQKINYYYKIQNTGKRDIGYATVKTRGANRYAYRSGNVATRILHENEIDETMCCVNIVGGLEEAVYDTTIELYVADKPGGELVLADTATLKLKIIKGNHKRDYDAKAEDVDFGNIPANKKGVILPITVVNTGLTPIPDFELYVSNSDFKLIRNEGKSTEIKVDGSNSELYSVEFLRSYKRGEIFSDIFITVNYAKDNIKTFSEGQIRAFVLDKIEEEPVVTEQPTTQEEPVVTEQPTTQEEPVVSEQPATQEEPVVSEQPIKQEEPITQEQPVKQEEHAKQEEAATAQEINEIKYVKQIDFTLPIPIVGNTVMKKEDIKFNSDVNDAINIEHFVLYIGGEITTGGHYDEREVEIAIGFNFNDGFAADKKMKATINGQKVEYDDEGFYYGSSDYAYDAYTVETILKPIKNEEKPIESKAKDRIWSNASSWALEELDKAQENVLIPIIFKGADLTANITRLEFAHIAVVLYEKITGTPAKIDGDVVNPFTDTVDGAVVVAYNLGITNGTSETTFTPDALITREQMATMMTRALSKAKIDTSVDLEKVEKFVDDAEMHDWGRASIYYMSNIGIIKGIGDNKYGVLGNATREQALLISERSVEKLRK